MGLGGVDERFAAAGVAGILLSAGCDGRHEGLSQHKTVSSRSWDSGVEHPCKKTECKNKSGKRCKARKHSVELFDGLVETERLDLLDLLKTEAPRNL